MKSDIKSPKYIIRIRNILIIALLFNISLNKEIKENINEDQREGQVLNANEIVYFTVNMTDGYNPYYLKVLIKGINDNANTNHIISFYQQDQTFTKREQVFQSLYDYTEMWLKKEQINSTFYFTVECIDYPCDFNYIISEMNSLDIKIGETYTYYVTKETQEMKFNIIMNRVIDDNIKEYVVSIWAKGNKNIISELSCQNYEKHSKYSAYIIKVGNDIIKDGLNYTFTVKGEIGDLINIGSLIFIDSITPTKIDGTVAELSGFLKKNVEEQNCFVIYENLNHFSFSFVIYDTNIMFDDLNEDTSNNYFLIEDELWYYKTCINLPKNYNEIFYSIEIVNKNNNNPNNLYFPQSLGQNYIKLIEEGETIEIKPYKPDGDFKYLTYHIQTMAGNKLTYSIYSCENYPNCKIDSNSNKNKTIMPDIKSSSISFSKNELESYSSSNIDKKQKILKITCEEGIKTDIKEKGCLISINMYTDKNKIIAFPSFPDYRYIPKNSEDNFIIGGKNNEVKNIILNIEVLSGNLSINIKENPYKYYNEGNKYLYWFSNDELSLNIISNNNSFYMINYFPKTNNYNFLPNIDFSYLFIVGGNYLFQPKSSNEILMVTKVPNGVVNNKIYVGIYPLNNSFNVSSATFGGNEEDKPKLLNLTKGFYQDYWNIDNSENIMFMYTINNEENNIDFTYYMSIFEINNDTSDNSYSIILSNNNSQSFKFSKDFNIMKYSYIHIENNKNVQINFNLLNKGKYKMNLFLNEELKTSDYKIEKKTAFFLKIR